MPESYLVIGGNGLLGSHIVRLLLARGETAVAVFDIAPSADPDPRVRVFLGDITNREDLASAVDECNPSCIIHTAALIQGAPKDAMYRVNVEGTRRVIEAARAEWVQKLVYTSTASVVFDGRDQHGVDESAPYPQVPFDDYNGSKAIAERLVLAANEEGDSGLKTCSLRVAGLFGPGDRSALPGMMGPLQAGRTGTQLGGNTNKFDFTYIENAAHAHLLAADRLAPSHPKHHLVAGQAFFISNGEPRPFWEFVRALWKEAGHVPKKVTVIPRSVAMVLALLMEIWGWLTGTQPTLTRFKVAMVTTARWCNISKAREALDYEPIYTLDEGIHKSVEWWMESQKSRQKQL
ncbi:NAD(P)-binding protein [Daedalea quercina L-15889]|uniref:NAD(P)-binding protein n=1 Tax=Daedalea quercina L-15889 TaxID=1314783 RepID=A0A165N6J0_9APHY|nr:NAD(P)-binding protein [Daedalea quercina L-15889]